MKFIGIGVGTSEIMGKKIEFTLPEITRSAVK
jgi:hypothetical protein